MCTILWNQADTTETMQLCTEVSAMVNITNSKKGHFFGTMIFVVIYTMKLI